MAQEFLLSSASESGFQRRSSWLSKETSTSYLPSQVSYYIAFRVGKKEPHHFKKLVSSSFLLAMRMCYFGDNTASIWFWKSVSAFKGQNKTSKWKKNPAVKPHSNVFKRPFFPPVWDRNQHWIHRGLYWMKKQQIAAQKFQGTSKPETVSPNQEEIKQKHNLSCKSLAPKKKSKPERRVWAGLYHEEKKRASNVDFIFQKGMHTHMTAKLDTFV